MEKKWITVSFVVLSILVMSTAKSDAYEVKVRNPTKYKVTVNLLVDKLTQCTVHSTADIEPGASHTFHTGGWCPALFTGVIYSSSGSKFNLVKTDCQGYIDFPCYTCCKNLNFKIYCISCGSTDTEPENHTYYGLHID